AGRLGRRGPAQGPGRANDAEPGGVPGTVRPGGEFVTLMGLPGQLGPMGPSCPTNERDRAFGPVPSFPCGASAIGELFSDATSAPAIHFPHPLPWHVSRANHVATVGPEQPRRCMHPRYTPGDTSRTSSRYFRHTNDVSW